MSIHAELESILRSLAPVDLARLQQAKEQAKVKAAADKSKKAPSLFTVANDQSLTSLADALCVENKGLNDENQACSQGSFFTNLCLNETVKSGIAPRFACDADWISKIKTISADAKEELESFKEGYDTWEGKFGKLVNDFLQTQANTKTKVNIVVPLDFRLEQDGNFIEKVYFKEDEWKAVFGKLLPTTKIGKMTLWLILWVLQPSHGTVKPTAKPPAVASTGESTSLSSAESEAPEEVKAETDEEKVGIATICNFVARSIEVRSDPALSALKVAYDPENFKYVSKGDFEPGALGPGAEHVLATSLKYGNPHYITKLIAKPPVKRIGEADVINGYFLAMHDENNALFDYIANYAEKPIESDDNNDLLFLLEVALNCVKTRNNDTYLFKLILANNLTWTVMCQKLVIYFLGQPANIDLLVSVDRRQTLRNPLLVHLSTNIKPKVAGEAGEAEVKGGEQAELALGESKGFAAAPETVDYLTKVGRTASKERGPNVVTTQGEFDALGSE